MSKKMISDYKVFLQYLMETSSKNIILVPHELTDIDSFAAAWGLKELLLRLGLRSVVYLPKVSGELKYVIKSLDFPDFSDDLKKINEILEKALPYTTILVDFSSPERITDEKLKDIVLASEHIIALDHHIATSPPFVSVVLIKKYTSASEIVLDMIIEMNHTEILETNYKLATALIGGILYDTAFLSHATKKTFELLSILVEKGDYRKILHCLKHIPRDISERIARLKGAQRAQVLRLNDYLIVITHVGSYESSVASALIGLGADVALSISKKKNGFRVSGRSRGMINLGEIFQQIAEKYKGTGGGHPGAAAITLFVKDDEINLVLNDIVRLILEKLKNEEKLV